MRSRPNQRSEGQQRRDRRKGQRAFDRGAHDPTKVVLTLTEFRNSGRLAKVSVPDRTLGPRAECSDQEHMDGADQEKGDSAKEDEGSDHLERFMSTARM